MIQRSQKLFLSDFRIGTHMSEYRDFGSTLYKDSVIKINHNLKTNGKKWKVLQIP